MKKALTLTLCLLMSSVTLAGEPNEVEPGIVFTITTADGASTCANLGIEYLTEDRFAIGVLGRWFETDDKAWTPSVAGLSLSYLFDEFAKIDDETKPDNAIEEFLHQFHAQPYGGLAIVLGLDDDYEGQIRLNYKTGLLFAPTKDPNIAFVLDYTMGDWALTPEDKWAVTLGARIKL